MSVTASQVRSAVANSKTLSDLMRDMLLQYAERLEFEELVADALPDADESFTPIQRASVAIAHSRGREECLARVRAMGFTEDELLRLADRMRAQNPSVELSKPRVIAALHALSLLVKDAFEV